MRRTRYYLPTLLLALLLLPGAWRPARAQGDPAARMSGTEYYVAFMQNEDARGAATRFMGLMITSEVATTGQVEIPGSSPQSFSTRPGEITTIQIPRTLEMIYGEEPPLPSVHVTSRAPVAVYVLNSRYQSSGGYPAVPVELWRSTYLPMGLPNADGDRVSEFTVVAAYDTRVTISPSTRTNFKDAWQDITVNLRAGESFLVQARPGASGVADLSTSEISATRPIGVISGHVRTPISPNRAISLDLWASHQAMMLLPDSLWGHEYYSVPLRQTPDRFRLTAAFDKTVIEATHYPAGRAPEKVTIKLDRGDIFDSSTINGRPITGPVHWSSSQPFMLLQMRTSGSYGDAVNSPAVIPLTSVDRFMSHTTFVAPALIGNNALSTHTLTLVAKGSSGDPLGSVNAITLDGKRLAEVDPSAQWQAIDASLFYITLSIPAGGHAISSPQGAAFMATASGHDGNLGDFYSWNTPFWMPQVEADVTAPRITETLPSPGKQFVTVRVSDRTPSYFSGIENVTVVNSPGWKLSSPFIAPYPDNDADVTFETSQDPSGPLTIELRDRDGNTTQAKVSDGACSKAAYADRDKVVLMTSEGIERTDSVAIRANPCGDKAEVKGIDFGTGNAKNYLRIAFHQNGFPFTIPSNGAESLYFTIDSSAPEGRYVTTVTVMLDSATIVLPVDLNVGKRSGVAYAEGIESMEMSLQPNPFHGSTQLGFGRALGRDASVTISDYLGRAVRHIGGEELAGRSSAQWNGTDDRGAALPAGVYIVTLVDGHARSVRTATVVR